MGSIVPQSKITSFNNTYAESLGNKQELKIFYWSPYITFFYIGEAQKKTIDGANNGEYLEIGFFVVFRGMLGMMSILFISLYTTLLPGKTRWRVQVLRI